MGVSGWAAECGIYPGDTTNRFRTDYQQIYQTAQTPNLQNLVRNLASALAVHPAIEMWSSKAAHLQALNLADAKPKLPSLLCSRHSICL